MSKDIGVIGNGDFVLGFNLAGVRRTFAVHDAKEFQREIERLVVKKAENLGILIVPGQELDSLPPLLRKRVSESLDPVVIAMGAGAGEDDMREKVKRAIGIDLYKD